MSPTPEELKLGARAYERVRLYEKYGARNARQMPWIQAGCAVLLILLAFTLKPQFSRQEIFAFLLFILAAFLWGWAQNRMAKENYAYHKLILQLLEEKYGDALPWIAEEKQLVSARELEAKIAGGQHPVSHA
jgi:4-amino-4-deoxy-L-arabinose transferase-like glycosyltransferase